MCPATVQISAGAECGQAAFGELVERYHARIIGAVYGIVHNRDEAEEIAGAAFAKAYAFTGAFDRCGPFLALIYRMALNECYRRLRKKRVRRDAINELLAAMPEDDRLLIFCREVEACSVEELAELTGQSPGAVRVKLLQARRRLARSAACLRLLRGR